MRRKRTPGKATERKHTDVSLRAERRKTDSELRRARGRIADDADTLVQRARRRADDLLESARVAEDEALDQRRAAPRERSRLAARRTAEDRQLSADRNAVDRKVAHDRGERQRAYAGLLAIEREQTDRRLAIERRRADEAVTARDDFFAMVAHDLGNLLSAVSFNAAALARLDRTADGTLAVRHAAGLEQGTRQMVQLVGDLLDVARIEAGRLIVLPEPHDGGKLVQEAVAAFAPLAAARKVTLTTRIDAKAAHAIVERNRVLQVLSNLISNALAVTPRGGRITVRMRQVNKMLCFAVEDTGPGIARDKLERIFERESATRGRRSRGKGLGIGLHIARGIVEAHGGRIWAVSTPGRGSTFRFTLPITTRREPPPSRR